MDDQDFVSMFIIALIIGVGALFLGKNIGDDYWHKPCDQYSVSAYKTKELPARCIK